MANNSIASEAARPPEIAKLLERVKELLDSGKTQEAVKALSREDSQWARNARGVCHLRLGDANAAVDTLRALVVTRHLNLRAEAPLVFKTNLATALLLSGNTGGGESILCDIRDEQNEKVQKLRAAIEQWKARMSFWEKLRWWLGGEPARPFSLDDPPGDLW